jgi:tetratricopeptide (TPR) repeat protein
MRTIQIIIVFSLLLGTAFSQSTLQGVFSDESRKYREQGYNLQASGELRKALSYYQKAIELDPAYVEVYNDAGVIYEKLGQPDKALTMYKKALEIDEGFLPTYTNLALFYENRGDSKQAVQYWSKRYKYGQKGEYWREKARERMLKLASDPNIKKDLQESEAAILSRELSYKKKIEKAEQDAKNIEEARMRFEMALKLFDKADFSAAMEEVRTALKLNPQDKELAVLIADFYVLVKRAYTKQRLKYYTDQAMVSIDEDDYVAASKRIKEALSAIYSASSR